ncbi:MAG TPA: hypothetical protein ENK57_09575 [Polyangiaceae bacterium]|nr:hypothetical protein [Polyangiaceae bacterium]
MSDEHTRAQALMMRVTDEVATEAELSELRILLERHPQYRSELSDFRRIKATTDAMRDRVFADLALEPARPSPAAARTRRLGWGLLLAAFSVLLVAGGVQFFTAPDVPLWLEVGYALGGLGSLILLVHFARLRSRGDDPYQEIDL